MRLQRARSLMMLWLAALDAARLGDVLELENLLDVCVHHRKTFFAFPLLSAFECVN